MNDSELRKLACFVASLKINRKWTEEALFRLFRKNPDLAEKWLKTRLELQNVIKESVQFT